MNDLIGLTTYARQIGRRQSCLQHHQDTRADFPKPALVIEEHRRRKRLWIKTALDSYFAKIDQERLDRQEEARIRAAKKRAAGALHRWAISMFGAQDAEIIKREQLHQHGGGPESVCTELGIDF